jgi:hypothetical protein
MIEVTEAEADVALAPIPAANAQPFPSKWKRLWIGAGRGGPGGMSLRPDLGRANQPVTFAAPRRRIATTPSPYGQACTMLAGSIVA